MIYKVSCAPTLTPSHPPYIAPDRGRLQCDPGGQGQPEAGRLGGRYGEDPVCALPNDVRGVLGTLGSGDTPGHTDQPVSLGHVTVM